MKNLSIVFIIFLIQTNSNAQSFNYIDDHCFGTSYLEEGKSIARLNQLNAIVGFSTCYYAQQDKTDPNCELTGNSKDIWIVAFDDSLNKIWDKNYGTNSSSDEAYSIIPYKNGFLVAGHTFGDSSCSLSTTTKGSCDYILLYLDSLGNKINETRFGSIGTDKTCSATQTLDGGLFLSGSSNGVHSFDKTQNAFYYPNQTPFQADYDLWVIKLDSFGNKQWDRVFGGMDRDFGEAIMYLNKTQGHTILNDSNYLVYGSTLSGIGGNISSSPIAPPGLSEAIVFKVDKNGNKIWDKRFGCTGWTGLTKIIEKDNYYYIFGYKNNVTLPNYRPDLWIAKTDTSGNILWENTYGTSDDDQFADVIANAQGGFFALGSINSISNGTFLNSGYGAYDVVLMNFDTSGTLLTYKNLGANNIDLANSLILINDSTILVSATADYGISNVKQDAGRGAGDIWAVKLGYSNTTTSINQLQNNLALTVRPNPAKNHIDISGLPPATYTINTFSLDGRLVMSNIITSELSLPLSIESLQSGMYLSIIKNEKINTTIRWVKE
jgi:hypothetical protein